MTLPNGHVQVAGKRWIVGPETHGRRRTLQLSSVNLPGGVQARLMTPL